jgi:tetratricopeptide (TPR) repeat protein
VYDQYREQGFDVLSVAVDLGGADVVRPYTERTTVTTVIDKDNVLAAQFGFKIVPNGIFVDENGVIRLLKQGLRVIEPEHVRAVEQLITGEAEQIVLDDAYHVTAIEKALEQQLADTKFKLANEYLKQGRKEEALQELDQALLLDPENFLIRKQRWYIRHPERFAPEIDMAWQQSQYEQERTAEAARLGQECGPEGCRLPGYVPPARS